MALGHLDELQKAKKFVSHLVVVIDRFRCTKTLPENDDLLLTEKLGAHL